MKLLKSLFLVPSLLLLSNCTPVKPVYYHKMSCNELENKIAEAEGNIQTQQAFQAIDAVGNLAAAINGEWVSQYDSHTGTIGNYKADLARMENAFYAKGCHKH